MRDRSESVLQLREDEIWQLFEEARKHEGDEEEIRKRSPRALLEAIVNQVGLLNVVGVKEDARGYERRVMQFFHQSIQEYFIAQAINHRRGGMSENSISQIWHFCFGNLTGQPLLTNRKIEGVGAGHHVEPVVAESWQEAIALNIASMRNTSGIEVDDVIRSLLAPTDAPADVQRACVVLALHALADEPDVTDSCVREIVDAALVCLRDEDALNKKYNTIRDLAFAALRQTRFARTIDAQMLAAVIRARGDIGLRVIRSTMLQRRTVPDNIESWLEVQLNGLSKSNMVERVDYGLNLVEFIYYRSSKTLVFDLPPETLLRLRTKLFDRVTSAEDQVERCIMCWAFYWLVGAIFTSPRKNIPWLSEDEEFGLLSVVPIIGDDDPTLGFIGMLLSCRDGFIPVFAQSDWIYNCAVVADGASPQMKLSQPTVSGRAEVIKILQNCFARTKSVSARSGLATALGRMGNLSEETVEQMLTSFENDLRDDAYRDELLIYLAQTRSPRVGKRLLQLINHDSEFIRSRTLFGLLLYGDPSYLQEGLLISAECKKEFAYGLAGISDIRGRKILHEFESHADEAIRTAAKEGLKKAELWEMA